MDASALKIKSLATNAVIAEQLSCSVFASGMVLRQTRYLCEKAQAGVSLGYFQAGVAFLPQGKVSNFASQNIKALDGWT